MEADWELAGLIDDEGRLRRPVVTEGWRVPALVELEGTHPRWSFSDGDRLGRVIMPRPRLLEPFIALGDANPENIRDFARKWGVL
jgi:hypothetical protein